MKIYILRHEKRYDSPLFYTNLTTFGIKDSEKLKTVLNKEKLDIIYSSPFPRVLQTIMPYCLENNMTKKINIEYSLYETMEDKCFTKKDYKIELSNIDKEFILSNPDYESVNTIHDIKCPEEKKDIRKRVNHFIQGLIKENKNTDINILIASHAGVLSEIENYKHTGELYPQGGLMLLYNNGEYCNKPINY